MECQSELLGCIPRTEGNFSLAGLCPEAALQPGPLTCSLQRSTNTHVLGKWAVANMVSWTSGPRVIGTKR